ncbi:MAG: hypothetical protein ACRELZ_26280 [Candidatus Rokuibacteriota bacterium]
MATPTAAQVPPSSSATPAPKPAPVERAGPDIYYIWIDGSRLAVGENPYARIRTGNMRENQKFPTYLPLFYMFVAATHHVGVTEYADFLRLWRVLVLLSQVAIGVLLFVACWRAGHPVLGVFAALFWGLNRWTLYVARVAQIDFLPILCLLGSLFLFETRRRTSLLLFGLSLALKQIAVLVTPLYLVWTWRAASDSSTRLRATAAAAGWIALIPGLLSLPFLAWDAEAFVRSILFSATRDPDSHVRALAFGAELDLTGLPARLPMLLLLALAFVAAARGEIGRYMAVLLVLATFVDFNPVFFVQYVAWLAPFVVLAAVDRRA